MSGLSCGSALEPWHVMAEEGAVGGTVRFVDSSVERLEVKVSGLTPDRHRVLVNGRTVPLHATATAEAVAVGSRYKALAAGPWPAPDHSGPCSR